MPTQLTLPSPIIDSIKYLPQQQCPSPNPAYRNHDFNLIKDFLLQYTGSQDTFNAYRRESERLLQWAWLIKQKSILTQRLSLH